MAIRDKTLEDVYKPGTLVSKLIPIEPYDPMIDLRGNEPIGIVLGWRDGVCQILVKNEIHNCKVSCLNRWRVL